MSHLIEIRGLKKTYQVGGEAVNALAGVSLAVDTHEFLAIMGASGSGKSTMLNILGCLDTPSEGSYLLDGLEVASRSATELAHIRNAKLGFVFQSFNLLPRTSALENVELPDLYMGRLSHAERRARACELLRRVGLAGRELHTPAQLSGGQQQRVSIARALVKRPRLILADEPTAALDYATSLSVLAVLEKVRAAGTTVVMVTHNEEITRMADRVLRLRDGKTFEITVNRRPLHAADLKW